MDVNCSMIKYLMEAYRRGELNEEQQAAVLHHLLHCPDCMFLLTLAPVMAEN